MAQTLEQKIEKSGQWFNKDKRDKEIQEELLRRQTGLKVNSTIVGSLIAVPTKLFSTFATVGEAFTTSKDFIVGKRYVILNVAPGDDFTNVGFISVEVPFIATATTATNFTLNSQVYYLRADSNIFFNDVDSNLRVEVNYDVLIGFVTELFINNSKFNPLKTYPVFGKSPEVLSLNKIRNVSSTIGYFKIEVYN